VLNYTWHRKYKRPRGATWLSSICQMTHMHSILRAELPPPRVLLLGIPLCTVYSVMSHLYRCGVKGEYKKV
jgi:hypothetical protein